ncbi:MAG TPA: type III-A CRISPR-associated RAMP protein Csm3 [Firmicutes bacterium]|nr:type III-A CRISPR-associated RAMP protein Csm3 [Bacillota bacterium]
MSEARVINLTAVLECVTGLRIGGSEGPLAVGSIDNPIIRDPVTREPYIPGSSLKGKMRSCLERAYNKINGDRPCGCGEPDCPICVLFGPHFNTRHRLGPTRLLFRDAFYTAEQRERARKLMQEMGQEPVEVKTENIINRVTNQAQHPRQMERVIPGTEFEVNISLIVLRGEDENWFLRILAEGLKWLEDTYLGSSGSRGYGKIRFKDVRLDGKPWDRIV